MYGWISIFIFVFSPVRMFHTQIAGVLLIINWRGEISFDICFARFVFWEAMPGSNRHLSLHFILGILHSLQYICLERNAGLKFGLLASEKLDFLYSPRSSNFYYLKDV